MEGIRLETSNSEIDGMPVLNIAGEIDVYTAPKFKDELVKVLDAGAKHLIVNMAGVNYMDSSGLGVLLSAVKRIRPEGGTVKLVSCSGAIERVLRITRLDTIFTCYDSVPDAIASTRLP